MARNPYFRFQQFTVFHDKCAMKVGTDGTVLGAWVDVGHAKRALDIGTGTGLISLMIAQKNTDLQIDAIDIESNAIQQAETNVAQSPFSKRIRLCQTAMQDFAAADTRYDVIVTNPPFFTETLKSPDKKRAIARHADSLTAEELICFSAQRLTDNGRLSVIYPYEYRDRLISLGREYNIYPSRITNLYPTPQSAPKRILLEFSKTEKGPIENDLIIETERHVYSDEFKYLMKDFYLKEIAKNRFHSE